MMTAKTSPDVITITACAVFLLGVCQPAVAECPTWTDPAALNNNAATDSGDEWQPQVTTDGSGNWVAVWHSFDSLGGPIGDDADILVARSTDDGDTWTDPVPLNNNAATDSGSDEYPQVTTDGAGHWVAVWASDEDLEWGEGSLGTDFDILVALSSNNGQTWTDPEPLNNNATIDAGSDGMAQVTTDAAGNWVAVWESRDTLGDTIGGDMDILMALSNNNGDTWTYPVPLNNNAAIDSGIDGYPQVTTDGAGHWVAVWESDEDLEWGNESLGTDYDILRALSNDNGDTWTYPVPLNNNAATDVGSDSMAQVTTDGFGNWVAVWESFDSLGGTIGDDRDVLMARSSNNGDSWTDPESLNNNAATDSGPDTYQQVTTDGAGNWVAVWHSRDSLDGSIGTDGDILVALSTDNGLTWTYPEPLNNNAFTDSESDEQPQVTADGAGNWVAVWRSMSSLGGTIDTDFDILVARDCPTCLADHYSISTYCDVPPPPEPPPAPGLLSFTYDGISPEYGCDGSILARLFAGRLDCSMCKITRVKQGCSIQPFGALLCQPESVLVDVNGYWLGSCGEPNLIVVGGLCDDGFHRIYFLNPANGSICEEYVDDTLAHIGQMALDSTGRLFVGSVEGDCLSVIAEGVVEPFYCCPGQSPQAVTIDENDDVFLTCSGDGVMRKIAPDGTPIDEDFAGGLEGAVSQAIAPAGIFHGNMFVACSDRVMEVDLATGESTVFLQCVAAHGIAFDPEGFMYVSIPSGDCISKIGPALLGDMNGDAAVRMDDVPELVAALLRLPDAPLPIVTADRNDDGCANGLDVQLFVNTLLTP
ncbi:MAG: hypothetical protein JXQ75_11970 [Phycisphaerae bacterium]|nr:hypothetical protein [Phycisphaerae bacterium]